MEGERIEDTRSYEGNDIGLRELFRVILVKWKFIAVITGIVSVLTLVVSFLLTPIYRSTAVILPINEPITPLIEGSGLSSLVGLIGIGGGSSSSTIKVILKSNSIKENIINRHDMMGILFEDERDKKNNKWKDEPPTIWDGIRKMDDLVIIEEDRKTGAISISTDYRDPSIAADISKWFIEELRKTLQEKSFSMARNQRENIEEIIGSLKGHLKVPEGDIPDFSVFMRKMRDLEISEKAYEELLVQYYLAKFKEAKEDIVFQVIDEAKPPDKPIRPKKVKNTLIGFFISLLACTFYVLLTNKNGKQVT